MTTAQHKRNHTITRFTLLFVCTGCIPISYYMSSVMLHQIIFWSLDAVRHCYLCTTFNSSLWIKVAACMSSAPPIRQSLPRTHFRLRQMAPTLLLPRQGSEISTSSTYSMVILAHLPLRTR